MELIIASNNQHKIKEINEILDIPNLKILSLKDCRIFEDIPEIGKTFRENSLLKAYFVWTKTQKAVFADDSGLEVNALNGEPGVYSAIYAGLEKSDQKNNEKLLRELENIEDRSANFRTVITYISKEGEMEQFEGTVGGKINLNLTGINGFGYDPLFIPNGFSETFAQLGDEIKNTISHRKNALEKFSKYIKNNKK